jgi:hypothetical protein
MEAINLAVNSTSTVKFSNILDKWDDKITYLQDYRLIVMGFILMVQANVVVPVSVLSILHVGAPGNLLTVCAISSFAVLVSNLASEKIKYTIPIFAVSTIVNIAAVLYAFIAY